jgi:hypothetical protein
LSRGYRPARWFFRPADLVLYAAVAGLAFLLARGGGDAGRLLVHSPAGEFELPLGSDTVLVVDGLLGGVEVVIESGRARIAESPCLGRYCVMTGWISSGGETTVCLPSGVWLTCLADGRQPDAVSR